MDLTYQIQTVEKGAVEEEPKRPGYWMGTGIQAGAWFSDRDRTRRSPSPPEIAEYFRSIVFICARINFNSFSSKTLRLYVTTKRGESRTRLLSHETDSVDIFQTQYLKSVGELRPYTKGVQLLEEVTEHPLLESVMRPNPRWDHIRAMAYVSLCLDLFGRAHWWMESFDGMRPRNVWPLLTQYMFPHQGGNYELVDYFTYGNMVIPYDEVMEVMNVSARNPYALGVAAAEAGFTHSDLFEMFVSYERNIFEQGAAPRLLISNKDSEVSLGRAERERLQREINYGLVRGNQGIAWFVDGALDVKPLSFLPEGMAKLNIGNESLKRVANCFGVPVSLVDIDSANRSISDSEKKSYAELTIGPRCAAFASAMTKWTRARGKTIDERLRAAGSNVRTGYERLLWAFDNPVPEDEERQAKVMDMYIRNNTMLINESRAKLGLHPKPWGEEPWFQRALVQPSQLEREIQMVSADGKRPPGAVASSKPPRPKPPGPALPKPAADEEDDPGEEEVIAPKKALDPPKSKYADEMPLALTLAKAALVDIGLGQEDRYEDEAMSQHQRLDALHALRMNCRAMYRAIGEKALAEILALEETKGLGKKQKEAISRFFAGMRKSVKASVLAAALLVFGPGEPTAAEIKAIDEATAAQIKYLEGFKTATFEGEQALDGTFAARAEMYGGAVWTDGGNMIREVAIGSNLFTHGLRIHDYPGDDPCSDCQEEIDKGWHPIGEVVPLGASICRANCHCFVAWATEDGQEWIAGRGPLEEIAFGTR